jgi:hypothetical protein
MESHTLAQTVAYGDLGTGNPAVISPEYEREADLVIEIQLEKAGVRLAYLLTRFADTATGWLGQCATAAGRAPSPLSGRDQMPTLVVTDHVAGRTHQLQVFRLR